MPSDRTQEARERAEPWEHWADIDCVSCPDCAFTFADVHRDKDGGYSCPACAEIARDARVSTLETALREAEAERDGLFKELEREQAMFSAVCGNDRPSLSEAAQMSARTVAENVAKHLSVFHRGYTLTKADELTLLWLREMADSFAALAAAQEPPAAPCYVCGHPVAEGEGRRRDSKTWCPDHRPVWSHD